MFVATVLTRTFSKTCTYSCRHSILKSSFLTTQFSHTQTLRLFKREVKCKGGSQLPTQKKFFLLGCYLYVSITFSHVYKINLTLCIVWNIVEAFNKKVTTHEPVRVSCYLRYRKVETGCRDPLNHPPSVLIRTFGKNRILPMVIELPRIFVVLGYGYTDLSLIIQILVHSCKNLGKVLEPSTRTFTPRDFALEVIEVHLDRNYK